MRKRLLIGLLSAGLVAAMLPGVVGADANCQGGEPSSVKLYVTGELYGVPIVPIAGPLLQNQWLREEGTPNAPGQNMLVWIGKCTP